MKFPFFKDRSVSQSKAADLKRLEKIVQNQLNKILYEYNNGVAYIPPDNIQSYVDDGYKSNIHVYSVVTAITQRCTGIPFKHMNGENEIVNSELVKLLDRPNPVQSKDEFITSLASWLFITGNAYLYKISPDVGLNKGKVTELWLLPSHLVEIVGGGVMEPVKEYRVKIGYGQYQGIPADQVRHIKYFNPDYSESGTQLYGQSPLTAALLTIGANNSGYKALGKAYKNGSPAGMLTGTENTGIEFTEAQAKALVDRWNTEAGGEDNFRKMIFSRNPLQFISMGWSPVDMNIIEHLKYTLQDICNIYHAPIHLFSGEAATLDNYKESRKAIYTDCVLPFFDMLMPVIDTWLCPLYVPGSTMDYDTSVISELNQDKGVQAQSLSIAWWLTPNERRQQMGLTDHPDPLMNEIYTPVGMTPLGYEPMPGDVNDMTL